MSSATRTRIIAPPTASRRQNPISALPISSANGLIYPLTRATAGLSGSQASLSGLPSRLIIIDIVHDELTRRDGVPETAGLAKNALDRLQPHWTVMDTYRYVSL